MVMGELTQEAEGLVVGSGPGGYAAAFRAADLGLDVTMVDPAARPGGYAFLKAVFLRKRFSTFQNSYSMLPKPDPWA